MTLRDGIWDLHRAELFDTITAQRQRALRPCVYCGHPTRALSQVCLAHDDLIDLDDHTAGSQKRRSTEQRHCIARRQGRSTFVNPLTGFARCARLHLTEACLLPATTFRPTGA